MPISPIATACLTQNNTILQLKDITGAYSAGNTGGYGTPNEDSTDVTAATILITFPNGETQTVDVQSQLAAAAISASFVFTDVEPDYTSDGVYYFLYTVTAPSGTYTYKFAKLFLGNVRCCIDKLQVKVVDYVCDACETSTYIDRVHLAEGLYNSLLAMGGCNELTKIDKILTKLQALCDFESCNCN